MCKYYIEFVFQLRVITEKVICTNSSICSSQFCGLHLKSRHERLINFWCYLDRSMDNVTVHFRVNYRVRSFNHKFLIEYTEDACNLVRWYYQKDGKQKYSISKVFENMAPVIMPFVHVNDKCPIVGCL